MSDGAAAATKPLHVMLIAGEESGDRLGAGLMAAIHERMQGQVRFSGVGGRGMAEQGLASIFPMTDLSLMGIAAVVKALPRLVVRLGQTVRAITEAEPDLLVIIDSPDFSQRVAKAARRRHPRLRVVNYVSPSVWAWRPWRARSMRGYVDHVLALLPFEPGIYRELGGPPCTYVGHPLAEQTGVLRPNETEHAQRNSSAPVVALLPGSRRGEVARLLPIFLQAAERLSSTRTDVRFVLPTLPELAHIVGAHLEQTAAPVEMVIGPEAKHAALRSAAAALAASGTVTLELALAGVPTIAAYQIAWWEEAIGRVLVRVPTIVLTNLVLGENVVPEFVQRGCTPAALSAALNTLLAHSPERARQLAAFSRLDHVMAIGSGSPSEKAAEIVLSLARRKEPAMSVAAKSPSLS